MRLRRTTIHLGIRIADFFMDRHDIEHPQLYLLVLTCVALVAAKIEQEEKNVKTKETFDFRNFTNIFLRMF